MKVYIHLKIRWSYPAKASAWRSHRWRSTLSQCSGQAQWERCLGWDLVRFAEGDERSWKDRNSAIWGKLLRRIISIHPVPIQFHSIHHPSIPIPSQVLQASTKIRVSCSWGGLYAGGRFNQRNRSWPQSPDRALLRRLGGGAGNPASPSRPGGEGRRWKGEVERLKKLDAVEEMGKVRCFFASPFWGFPSASSLEKGVGLVPIFSFCCWLQCPCIFLITFAGLLISRNHGTRD